MAKYLTIWRLNPSASWPIDPVASTQLNEMMLGGIDQGLKSGRLLEVGWFANAHSGYAIVSGEAKDEFMAAFGEYPWIEHEMHEIIDYETGKEITRQVLKAKAEQMAAMKR